MMNDEDLIRGMKRCAQLGALAQVHAENGDMIAEVKWTHYNDPLSPFPLPQITESLWIAYSLDDTYCETSI